MFTGFKGKPTISPCPTAAQLVACISNNYGCVHFISCNHAPLMLACALADFSMLMKGTHWVMVKDKHMGRATSLTMIMTDAWIGLTISSYSY